MNVPPKEGRQPDFDPGAHASDDEWLSVVVICLADAWDDNVDEARKVVQRNRLPCLHARTLGFEPWQVALFIQSKTGP